MSSSAEMKRVITHAADQLHDAIDVEVKQSYSRGKTIAAMALAEGVLVLLASYLEVTGEPPGPKPARDERGRFLRSVDSAGGQP